MVSFSAVYRHTDTQVDMSSLLLPLVTVTIIIIVKIMVSFSAVFLGNDPGTLKVKLETEVEPDSNVYKDNATNKLYNKLRLSSVKKQLSIDLSKKLHTRLEVDNVYSGSVMIELRLKDYTELENIKSLSDTGVLSNIFGSLLLTPDYKSSCLADKVYIDARVDDRSYQALMEYARGSFCY